MQIELVEAPWLPKSLKDDKKDRPWVIHTDLIGKLRKLFPMWIEQRHGIVVYRCDLMDSSSFGSTTFMPRMYQATDDSWHPAPTSPSKDSVAAAATLPVDWIDRYTVIDGWNGLPTEDLIDRAFVYEAHDGEKGRYRRLMTGNPVTGAEFLHLANRYARQ